MASANVVLLRRPLVERRVGLPRSTIYWLISRGEFPRPIKLGKRSVAWPAAVIDDWIKARIAESDSRGDA